MALVLSILGIAISSVCVWLAVRVINRRERWAKRTLAGLLVGLPAIYALSFVPAFWIVDRGWIADRRIATIYWPIVALISRSETADSIAIALGSVGASDPIFTIVRLESAVGLPQHRAAFWPADDQHHDVPHRSNAW